MTIDLGSEVLDVLFALAFIYFLLSVVVSAVTEAISWFLQQRARNLEDGVRTLLADPDLSEKLLEHPLMNRVRKERKHLPKVALPSYVSPRNFALALTDLVLTPGRQMNAAIADLPEDLRRQLGPLVKAASNDVDGFRSAVEQWYDDAMDRVSGWYKRWAQLITVVLAVLVTLALNVDTVRVAERLFTNESVRSAVVKAGEVTIEKGSAGQGTPSPSASDAESDAAQSSASDPIKAGEGAETAIGQLNSLALPIGWEAANAHLDLAALAGWLLSVAAISLGAPFWFDALGRISRLRTTGGKPQAEQSKPQTEQ